MGEPYAGEDGLARDIKKLAYERSIMTTVCEQEYKRFNRKPTFHNATNIFVEEARCSPYYVGHQAMWMATFIVGLGIFSWVQVFSTLL